MGYAKSNESIFSALEEGATVLASNLRLARFLRAAYNERQQARGRSAWQTPDVITWTAWLQRCWSESLGSFSEAPGNTPRLVLSPLQEQALWERIIVGALDDRALLQVHAMAGTVREAWQLLHNWRLSIPDRGQPLSADGRAFAGWARAFVEICDAERYLDGARLAHWVAAAYRSRQLKPFETLLMVGFDELTPQQDDMLSALKGAGCRVVTAEPRAVQEQVRRIALPSTEDEINAAACWARRLLEQDPTRRIGIVVHHLETLRERIARVLDDVLLPALVLAESVPTAKPYNISLGKPLLEYPVVRTAFLILDMARTALPLESMGALLRSPFLAGAEREMTQRGLLDAELRRDGALQIKIETLLERARATDADGGSKAHTCPLLATQLEGWRDVKRSLPRAARPGDWARLIDGLLNALGWPGERPLESDEYQTVQAWGEQLRALSTLNEIMPNLSFGAAVAQLKRLAAERIFQPEGEDVPLQVLGMLEAAGAEFDHLWLMGLHDEVWPASPRPNPFLAFELQRERGMPHASAEREYAFAQRLTQRLLGSAPEVIVSHPLRENDRDLRPSPLIKQLVPVDGASLGFDAVSYKTMIHDARSLEYVEDHWGPAIPHAQRIPGGAAIFQQQAACPFRAFAELRLGARCVDTVSIGLDPMGRGLLVHNAMEAVWRDLETHGRLAAYDEEKLRELVRRCVTEALRRRASKQPQTFTEKFTALEQQRLERLVSEWLTLERNREPARNVITEETRELVLGGIECTLRIDRIDELPDGRRLIIDYKTGTTSVKRWFGERPDEPQLPLYALSEPRTPVGLLFAQIRAGEMGFTGLTADSIQIPGVRRLIDSRYTDEAASWDALMMRWRQVLTRLAEAYRSGWAAVDPKDPPATCRYCEQHALCRIHERAAFDPTDGSDAKSVTTR